MRTVFLTYAPCDASKVDNIIPHLLDARIEFVFPEGCADNEINPDIRRKVGEKIVQANVTVCLISQNSYKSPLVDLALEKSRNKGNRIIAMALEGVKDAVLPNVIREENLTFYPWNAQRLKKIILQE